MSTESERKTRQQRIDPKLKGSGWSVVPFAGVDPGSYSKAAVEEFETRNGPADYALCDEGQVMGVVEAKKLIARARKVSSFKLSATPEALTQSRGTRANSVSRSCTPPTARRSGSTMFAAN